MYDSFDKGWFVLQTYSGYENKVKENLLQRAHTYNMLENILRQKFRLKQYKLRKMAKLRKWKKIVSRAMYWLKWS